MIKVDVGYGGSSVNIIITFPGRISITTTMVAAVTVGMAKGRKTLLSILIEG